MTPSIIDCAVAAAAAAQNRRLLRWYTDVAHLRDLADHMHMILPALEHRVPPKYESRGIAVVVRGVPPLLVPYVVTRHTSHATRHTLKELHLGHFSRVVTFVYIPLLFRGFRQLSPGAWISALCRHGQPPRESPRNGAGDVKN